MVDEVRQSLMSVLVQADGWQKSLNRIVQSSRLSGTDRNEVITQLLSLEDSGPGLSYLAMAHAMWMEETQQVTSALNSWNRASRNHGGSTWIKVLASNVVDCQSSLNALIGPHV